jgi:hypothetical protein
MTFTQKAKTLVGKSVAITTYVGAMSRIEYTYAGVVESVKGLNGDSVLVTFTNGKSAYYGYGDSLEIL